MSPTATATEKTEETEVFSFTTVYRDSSQVTDVKTFERVFAELVPTLGDLFTASQRVRELKVKLAEAMILIRRSITFRDQPDYYGESFAYQTAFTDRMRPALVAAGIPGDQIDSLLTQARTNHLNKDRMLTEAIIRDAIRSGDIKEADATKFEALVSDAGGLKNVPPKSLPASVKRAANKVAKSAKKSEPFPAEPSSRNNPDPTHENPAALLSEALESITDVLTRKTEDGPVVAPLESLQAIHATLTTLSDACTGGPGKKAPEALAGGKSNVANAWSMLGHLCNATAAYLAEKGTKDAVDEHRLVITS